MTETSREICGWSSLFRPHTTCLFTVIAQYQSVENYNMTCSDPLVPSSPSQAVGVRIEQSTISKEDIVHVSEAEVSHEENEEQQSEDISETVSDSLKTDENLGKKLEKVPINITASWDKGVIHCHELNLSSQTESIGPPASAVSSHAPLVLAAASFCQEFHEKATKEGITITSLRATATSEANLTAFYDRFHDRDANEPWKSIDMTVEVESDVSQEELQFMAEKVQKTAPSQELLREHFCIEVQLQVDTLEEEEVQAIGDYCDVETYREICLEKSTVLEEQTVTCTYSTEEGNPVFQIQVGDTVFPLSATETVPLGATVDGNPTPVQAFFFGSLAYYMHTFVMRLALKGYGLNSLSGTFKTTMNNGVKNFDDGLDPTVFSILGGDIRLDVKSDASKLEVEKAFLETQDMVPTYLATSGLIEINLDMKKA